MKSLASIVSLALLSFITVDAHAQQPQCGDGACVHIGTSILSITGSQGELLDSTLSSLSGVNIDLTQGQYQDLLSATVNLDDLTASIQSNGLADSPASALTNELSVSQVTDAVADTLRSAGATPAADAVAALSAQTSGSTGKLALGKLLGGDTTKAVLSQSNVNALDLVNSIVSTSNLTGALPAKPVMTTGSALGLNVNIGNVTITVVAIDQPVIVCGPVGTKFYSGALRVRIHADLTSALAPLNLGVLTIGVNLSSLDLVVNIARATGTIQAVDAMSLAVTVEVTPGVAELYLGKVSDVTLADRETPLNIASNVDYATIGSVTVSNVLNVNAMATIDARGYALGTNPNPITLMFAQPYPQTKSAVTSPNFISQLVSTLLSSLDVRVNAFAGGLNIGSLLAPVISTLTSTLKTAGGVLGGLLTTLITTAVEPLLDQLGLGLGRVDVTVDHAYHIPPGSPCNDNLFCTDNDVCNANDVCAGTPRSCTDGLTCTTDTCNETTKTCSSSLTSGCLIAGKCAAANDPNPSNACQSCNTAVSRTSWTNKTRGATCNDGLGCTVNDACDGSGNCTSGTAKVCTDGLSCTTDSCTEPGGTCVSTVSSGCVIGGNCYGSGAPNPSNPCQVCRPSGSNAGWSNQTSGTTCSDGLFCTQNDTCNGSGGCTGAPRSCSDGVSCTDDTCNESNDSCEHTTSGGGCTIDGTCYPPGAPNPTNACQWCNTIESLDHWANRPSGTGCSDGSFCTVNEECDGSGSCVGQPRDCGSGAGCSVGVCDEDNNQCTAMQQGCVINGTCYGAGAINPGNPCQYCAPGTSPGTWTLRSTGSSCSDGAYCTVGDTCNSAGQCVGSARQCPSGNSCGASFCNEQQDRCEVSFNSGCRIDSVCWASGSVNPYDPCQVCDPTVYAYGWTSKAVGASCEDGLYCTVNETCNGSGQCVGAGRSCGGGGSGCQAASCNEDENRCETYVAGCFIDGGCYATSQINPGNPCEWCAPPQSTLRWTNRNLGAFCSDGKYCTVGDACDGFGFCAGGARDCNDGCNSGSCNEPAQQCETVALSGCSIGNACWGVNFINPLNRCQWCQPSVSPFRWTGRPSGSSCSGLWDCYAGSTCNGDAICVPGGGICNDGLGCTVDSCEGTSGQCYHTALSGCAIGGACWAEGSDSPESPCQTCRPEVSVTQWTNKPAETSCSNGAFCNSNYCNNAGACISRPRVCDDGISCTVDSCDEAQNRCVATPDSGRCQIDGGCYQAGDTAPDNDCKVCDPNNSTTAWSDQAQGASCVDGIYCTINRTCNGSGVCEGGAERNCNDNIMCSIDTCDEDAKRCRHAYPDVEGCVIDTVCWANHAINPNDDCQECDAARAGEAWSYLLIDRCVRPNDTGTDDEDAGPDNPQGPLAGGGLAGGSADSKCSVGASLGGSRSASFSLWTWLVIWGLFIWRKRRD